MFRIRLDAEQLTRTRFAVSPLVHAMSSLMAVVVPSRLPDAGPWVRTARQRLAKVDLGDDFTLLRELVDRKSWYIPDFLYPIPATAAPTIDEELATVATACPERIAFELNLAFDGDPVRTRAIATEAVDKLRRPMPEPIAKALRDGEAAFAERLAAVLEQYWTIALAPDWQLIKTVLEEDLLVRGRSLATEGAAKLFADLHQALRWDGEVLTLESPHEVDLTANANGLVLAPCVFTEARPFCLIESLDRVMLGYRARGSAKVWNAETPTEQPKTSLIGGRRTQLLEDLDVPRAASHLAARQLLAPPTVSYHLGLLHRAGLVRRRRVGKQIFYERTPAAETLLGLAGI
ncbi:ArsR/SmtB family transcription factor [Tenggerimyces flavus]|uniref:ArsR/SmtB family transcription factor n=1 Tax=Tenggerimyces flavus TaxID=1708749 RepID=A0ABV7YNE9_9ACTN|nr:helix-turn-helix domain-containing protein [Tenggerimyces flavus]MBM7784452.1 DNA-binding transcriptional ArsR family regulator [Tenggerimyces flavus]